MLLEKVVLNLLTVLMAGVSSSDRTLINTTTGPIKGTILTSFGVQYYAFQGIPYAEKPIGNLRFKPPTPKKPWSKVLDASKSGYVCPQPEGAYMKEEMGEDCLFLNVFVPANKTDDLLPVLVYIPGGQFKSRSGNANDLYGPQFLMRHDIIMVSLNYRLGALGFLSLEDEEAPGNFGLKDIVLALQWINENVDRFGGNRKKITVGGNSAGAVATHYLLLSSKSAGLYHQAILISGSALGYRFLTRYPKKNALALAKELGIQFSSSRDLIAKLKEVDAFDIVEAQEAIDKNDHRKGFRPFAPFVPCIEIEHPDAFITKEPRKMIQVGIPNNVPILAGFNSEEGLKMIPAINKNHQLIDYLNADFQLCIPTDIGYPKDSEESKNLSKSIQNFYFGQAEISDANLQQFIKLITDTMFAHSIDYWMKLHKSRPGSNILYTYLFGFDGKLNWFKVTNKVNLGGTAHADELGYIFVTNDTKPILNDLDASNLLDARSHRMVDTMTAIISNFVKFGNPTSENNNIGIDWQESGITRDHLYIYEQLCNVNGRPFPKRLQFWDDIYEKYYQYVENGGRVEYNAVP